MSHGTHMNESRLTETAHRQRRRAPHCRSYLCSGGYICDMTHMYACHDLFTCVIWNLHMCDMTCSHVWYDSFICVTWLIHMCDMTCSEKFTTEVTCAQVDISVIWLICMRAMTYMTHLYACYMCGMSIISATRLAQNTSPPTLPLLRLYICDMMWHDSLVCVVRGMTRLYLWHDSFTCVAWLIYMCDRTHLYVWHGSFTCVIWFVLVYMCRLTWLAENTS